MYIESERLIIRPYTLNDIEDLYQIISDKETMKYFNNVYNRERTRYWIEWSINHYNNYGYSFCAVILKENNKMIGNCGLTMQNINGTMCPEIGYHINKHYWRQGIGSEAAKMVRDWAFLNTPYNELYSYMSENNIPSSKVAIQNGMSLSGKYQEEGITYLIYKITRTEWENVNK